MAATAVQMNSEPIEGETYQSKVQALTDVIVSHSPGFHRIAVRHLNNVADAEDAVQDALLSALRHVQEFRGQAKMSTWLTTIVINSARTKLRKRSVKAQVALDQTDGQQTLALGNILPDTRPSPEEAFRKQEISRRLAGAVSQLSPILRRTFHLRDVNGLSIRETADFLGVPTGTVKARLARARMRLREVIRESVQQERG
jgi:RNA polymerase sigma-70 factor, ECF subfamily